MVITMQCLLIGVRGIGLTVSAGICCKHFPVFCYLPVITIFSFSNSTFILFVSSINCKLYSIDFS